MQGLSSFYPSSSPGVVTGGELSENSAPTRRKLRILLAERGGHFNQQLLDAFFQVKHELQAVEDTISEVQRTCEALRTRLKTTTKTTNNLLEQTAALSAAKEQVTRRAGLVQSFVQRFQLTAKDQAILEEGEIGPAFLDTLAKLRQARHSCSLLLRSVQHTAGVELLDALSRRQDAAFKRLYVWVQGECRKSATVADPGSVSQFCN